MKFKGEYVLKHAKKITKITHKTAAVTQQTISHQHTTTVKLPLVKLWENLYNIDKEFTHVYVVRSICICC